MRLSMIALLVLVASCSSEMNSSVSEIEVKASDLTLDYIEEIEGKNVTVSGNMEFDDGFLRFFQEKNIGFESRPILYAYDSEFESLLRDAVDETCLTGNYVIFGRVGVIYPDILGINRVYRLRSEPDIRRPSSCPNLDLSI